MRKPISKIKRLTGSVFPVSATLILLLFSHWLHAAPPAGSPRVIPEHYIVVFKDNVDTDVVARERERIYRPMKTEDGIGYERFEQAIRQVMTYYMGFVRNQRGMKPPLND